MEFNIQNPVRKRRLEPDKSSLKYFLTSVPTAIYKLGKKAGTNPWGVVASFPLFFIALAGFLFALAAPIGTAAVLGLAVSVGAVVTGTFAAGMFVGGEEYADRTLTKETVTAVAAKDTSKLGALGITNCFEQNAAPRTEAAPKSPATVAPTSSELIKTANGHE